MGEERLAGRMFNSMAAAEEAYRLQQQNIDTLVLKIDGLADLVKTLATAITTLVSLYRATETGSFTNGFFNRFPGTPTITTAN